MHLSVIELVRNPATRGNAVPPQAGASVRRRRIETTSIQMARHMCLAVFSCGNLVWHILSTVNLFRTKDAGLPNERLISQIPPD
jgi:hypothetical protein